MNSLDQAPALFVKVGSTSEIHAEVRAHTAALRVPLPKCGGLKGDQVKRLKELETENTRLRRAVSDLTLDKLILAEAAKGNFSIRGA